MRLLKGFILTLGGFFVLITLLSLLMPSDVITSRTVTIEAPPAKIMQQVIDMHTWRNWHPLFAAQTIKIVGAGKGQQAAWTSGGKQNQLQLTNVSTTEARFLLIRPGENNQENKISVFQYKDSSNVQVEWSARTHLKWYPWEKFSGIFVDKMTGPGYEAALSSLKNYLEQH